MSIQKMLMLDWQSNFKLPMVLTKSFGRLMLKDYSPSNLSTDCWMGTLALYLDLWMSRTGKSFGPRNCRTPLAISLENSLEYFAMLRKCEPDPTDEP